MRRLLPSVAVLLLAGSAASAQGSRPVPTPTFTDPVALVTWLVTHGEAVQYADDRTNGSLFSPGLRTAMRASLEKASRAKEVPCGLDGNVILECQECGPAQHLRVASQATAPDRATVSASFDIVGTPRSPRFMAVLLDGTWKIENIVNAEGGSLRRQLQCLR